MNQMKKYKQTKNLPNFQFSPKPPLNVEKSFSRWKVVQTEHEMQDLSGYLQYVDTMHPTINIWYFGFYFILSHIKTPGYALLVLFLYSRLAYITRFSSWYYIKISRGCLSAFFANFHWRNVSSCCVSGLSACFIMSTDRFLLWEQLEHR